MRTLIYLPIIALVLLCSCKGNSFMTQRYTKYGHKKNTTEIARTNNHLKNAKQQPAQLPVNVTTTQEVVLASTNVSFTKEDLLRTEKPILFPASTNSQKNNSVKESKQSEETVNANDLSYNKKASNKKHAAAGVVGTLFKIVLWIIILAVVVGIIILVGALA